MTRNQSFPPISKDLEDYKPRTFKLGLILFGIVGAILAWGLTFHQLEKSRIALLDRLDREQKNLSSVLAENLFQILDQRKAIEQVAMNKLKGSKQFLTDIEGYFYSERAFSRIVFFETSGKVLYHSSPLQSDKQATQESMRSQIEQALTTGHTLILRPDETFEIPWHISLLFPIKNGDAEGAMLLELDIGYVLNIINEIDIGRSGEVVIGDDKGNSLAIFESGGLSISKSWSQIPAAPSLEGFSGSGIFNYPGQVARQFAFIRVKDYPITISVSREIDDFLYYFYEQKTKLIWALLILTGFYLSAVYLLLKMENRKHEYLSALSSSYTKNKELIDKLEQEHKVSAKAASLDALTGLFNRRLFIYMAEQQHASARRKRHVCAVLFIDLDRFKTINDTLGHHVGDLLLINVAKRLTECTRKSDIVARFGGDEFVIFLSEMSHDQNIIPILDKIVDVVSKPYEDLDGYSVNTSPSVGVAVYPRDGDDIESLLINADAAMYKSKKAGRGRYRFFDASLNRVSIEKFEIEQRIPAALRENQFVLHYQPKINLGDFHLTGLEALIRWQIPDQQLIYPNDFIEIAESAGLILQLGSWVLKNVCGQLINWQNQGLHLVPVAVNVSSLELQHADYAQRFLATLDNYRISPKILEIEITESALIEDKNRVIENLNSLSSHGVQITLDDYGMGFSTLDNIRTLPIHALKIDRSFIREIRNTYSDSPIVHSTITLAKKLGLIVIAEGIETREQVVNLKVAGCDQVQGYYFSRPVDEEKIREFLAAPIRNLSA